MAMLSEIASEACTSGIGNLGNPVQLWQAIASLSNTRAAPNPPTPPAEGLLLDLVGYWNGTSPDPDLGSIESFQASAAMTWGAGGPNSGGAGHFLGVTSGNFPAVNEGFGAMVTGPSTVNMFFQLEVGNDVIQSIFNYGVSRYDVRADFSDSGNDTFYLDYSDDACGTYYPSITIPNVGPWMMLTLAMTSTSAQLYVNGVLLIDEVSSLWCTDATFFRIGAQIGAWTWDGHVANIGYWTRVLTQLEIDELYNGGLGLTASEL